MAEIKKTSGEEKPTITKKKTTSTKGTTAKKTTSEKKPVTKNPEKIKDATIEKIFVDTPIVEDNVILASPADTEKNLNNSEVVELDAVVLNEIEEPLPECSQEEKTTEASGKLYHEVENLVTETAEVLDSSDLLVEGEKDLVDWFGSEEDDDDWSDEWKGKRWHTKGDYDKNRPWYHTGVVFAMKGMKYVQAKKELDIILWALPPWEYQHKIYGVRFSPNAEYAAKYAKGRKRPFQSVPVYLNGGPRYKLRAFEHLVRQLNGGTLLVFKDKDREDGAVNRLIRMAESFDITVKIVEY